MSELSALTAAEAPASGGRRARFLINGGLITALSIGAYVGGALPETFVIFAFGFASSALVQRAELLGRIRGAIITPGTRRYCMAVAVLNVFLLVWLCWDHGDMRTSSLAGAGVNFLVLLVPLTLPLPPPPKRERSPSGVRRK